MDARQKIKLVSFAPGEILFREHEKSFQFYIIQEGTVEVYKTTPENQRIVLAEISSSGEHSSIGEFALIDNRPRSATAEAKTHVKAVEVSAEAFEKLLLDLPDWAVSMMRGLVARLRSANEIIKKNTAGNPNASKEIDSAEFDPDSGLNKVELEDDSPNLA